MAAYTLTIRNGPAVERERHPSLEAAVEALGARVGEIRAEGGLPEVKMLREFHPGQQVKARLEISSGRFLRRREAGVDVMGDGSLVAFRGGIFRKPLDPPDDASYLDAVAGALRE